MTEWYQPLKGSDRLLLEAELTPLQGNRFQPTGFPDLGAAEFTLPDGTPMLLVESSQSMANRMETACWDEADEDIKEELKGLPYVKVLKNDRHLTNSLLEAHRINSPYILEGKDQSFVETLKSDVSIFEKQPVNIPLLARFLLKYDVGSLLHGIFISKKELAGGRLRIPRAISSFIEASNVRVAMSGGTKIDRVDPKGDTKKGFGNVPFPRMEYTAEKITAYFNIDINQLKGYQVDEKVQKLLLGLSLYKILNVLEKGLRLRTACDLNCQNIKVTKPKGFSMPSLEELTNELPDLIQECREYFTEPPVTTVEWKEK